MNLVDTHFHLDLFPHPEVTVQEIEENRIYTIAVTNTPSVFDYTYNLTKNLKYVRAALGLHPELALRRKSELPLFKEKLAKTRYIGEIGLDYGGLNEVERHQQRQVFAQILDYCALTADKILTVHSRSTASDVLDAFGNHYPGKIILHWFSGSMKELERAIDLGFYFSINSAMIQSEKGKKIISVIPDNKLLTETDGPFIRIGNRPAIPIDINMIVSKIATLKNIKEEVLILNLKNNFKSLII